MKNKDKNYINSKCPLCGSNKIQTLHLFKSTDAAKHVNLLENDPRYEAIKLQVEKLWKSDLCYFVRCNNCSYDFAIPNVSGDSEFYSLIYSGAQIYPGWKWEFDLSYHILEQLINKDKPNNLKLLEIGAGNGNFIKKVASELISKENILATEFSSFGKNEIENFGIKCLSIDIQDLDINLYRNYFDIICIFQVLEHISNLNDFMNSINIISKAGANLFISVPNSIQRLHYIELGMNEDVPPIHVGRWNKDTFEYLAEKYGWRVVAHSIQSSPFLGNIKKYISNKFIGLKLIKPLFKVKVRTLRRTSLGISLILITPLLFIFNLKAIRSLSNKELGVSQFVHLKKIA